MASHVTVIDSSARRATVKTTPDKHLTDVLQEACQKLGKDVNLYGLKSNNKALDLSLNIRLSGLSSGAKLELVLLSRSPSVVSVALQLPVPDSEGVSRLTDKFPSSTTIWLILRKFESGGAPRKRNLTGRGVPQMESQDRGAGRMYFETPVIQVMGRELVSFTDLQKSLAQLGFNSGSILLRLSFRTSETPLEEAMEQIGRYFQDVESKEGSGAHAGGVVNTESTPAASGPLLAEENTNPSSPPEPLSPSEQQSASQEPITKSLKNVSDADMQERSNNSDTLVNKNTAPSTETTTTGPSHRPISVFAPPSSSTPKAATHAFDEKDYEPTIDHAKLHQSRLSSTTTNKRLLSDAELAAQANERSKKNADVKEVEIKVRFPDQTQVVSKFSSVDTASVLYKFVRDLMVKENEPFSLKFSAAGGPKTVPGEKDSAVKLISGLGIVGRVLVSVVWEDGASPETRGGAVLKSQFQDQARQIEVKEIEGTGVEERSERVDMKGKGKEENERKGGVPKWLKLPGRK